MTTGKNIALTKQNFTLSLLLNMLSKLVIYVRTVQNELVERKIIPFGYVVCLRGDIPLTLDMQV